MTNFFMTYPNWKEKAVTFSYDDGNVKDRDLVEMLNKHGLKGTFNLNSNKFFENGAQTNISNKEIAELYKNHEVAVHTVTHPRLELLPQTQIAREIMQDKEALEGYSGTIVRGMAYPFGTFSDEVVDVAKLCGIVYSRTVESHHGFKVPTDWLRMGTTCHHADDKIFELAEKFIAGEPSKQLFRYEGWLFYIWGHSYEFRTEEDFARMDKLLSMISGRDDIWYATNIEVYDYVEAFRALVYSCDKSMVYNPSAQPVYFIYDNKKYVVNAGETITL